MTITKRDPRAGEAFKDRVKQSASVVTESFTHPPPAT
jgi:hypothetical protein